MVRAAKLADGSDPPTGPVDDRRKEQIGNLSASMRIKIDWTWNGTHSRVLAPEPFVDLRSPHFRIAAVPAWSCQSQTYLAKLERYYVVLRAATGRPGPNSIKVDWRHNTHSARASVGRKEGGQKDVWMSLPFSGYEKSLNPYDEPWFMGHELLHTFGYHHGDEMRRLQQLVQFQFAAYRWYLVDHPEATR